REQSYSIENRQEGTHFGGVRTYALFSLVGALAMLLAQALSIWLLPVFLVVICIPLMIAYANDCSAGRDRGITSELAFVLTFILGALTTSAGVIPDASRKYQVVACVAVAATALLSLKEPLHQFAARISRQDVMDTVKFLLLAVIVLPFLPDQVYGPLDVINPFEIGMMIVLIAGLGFVGYILIRALGPGRGMGLTGLIGGLVSSTAVTLASAGRAKERPELANVCALAIVLASSVMIVRVTILIVAVEPRLWVWVAAPFAAILVAGLICAAFFWKRQKEEVEPAQNVDFKNPVALGTAVKFGILFAVVLLVTKAAAVYVPQGGIYLAALIAGLTDMDAISLSVARLVSGGQLAFDEATIAILIAAAANTVVKGTMAAVMGGWVLGRKVLVAFVLSLIAGAAGMAASLLM
ncbi:MAG TPA: DUF4010 domain-containing protein, partial [Planctomycetota bacterium]|nr:DUF4010 domain-containing protein [Planctomycetota bacterium]